MTKPFFQYKGGHNYALSGTLSVDTVPTLWQQSQDVLKPSKGSLLTFNLEHVTQSDSSGVALLISWTRMLNQCGQKICFVRLPSQMLAIIQVSDLEKILPIKI
jgi:phospholipid transport system transporter-binding protein